ncbi:uncharacterized protein LOC120320615 [Drosophila yakuba]|uniref:uncharacterized protein LOC120320615 n=1 Tax=Drosophila yakuba TaxID=7245 RepID=UPI0019307D43|nr:uncharacterized protein LOC120320615 [Drosophila yakuba]
MLIILFINLTRETLDNNVDLLCKHASVLFEGKANEFYWRYHKAHGDIQWNSFCTALRLQFRDSRDDCDIEELIRNSKQKQNESFDSFYDTISGLVDQLEHPWTTSKLIRVLRNYLRPEIRHEILNIDIKTVSDLRQICRRRETFLADVKRVSGYVRSTPFKREVAEFSQEYDTQLESEPENEADVEAFSLLCWNCRKEGHRYQDCVSERRIFCYGYGAVNTYKPSCNKCSKNPKHVEVAIQTEDFDCLSEPIHNNRRVRDAANVAQPPIPDEQQLPASSLLHSKIQTLKKIKHEENYLQNVGKRKARNSSRIKAFWQNVKNCRIGVNYIKSLPEGPKDPRPFLPIRLFNRTVYGLLDSSESASCVGGNLDREVEAAGNYKAINSSATTADGRSQQIRGHIQTEVEYGDQKKVLKIYIVPSLKQDLYLGIDFWRRYDLLPRRLIISI